MQVSDHADDESGRNSESRDEGNVHDDDIDMSVEVENKIPGYYDSDSSTNRSMGRDASIKVLKPPYCFPSFPQDPKSQKKLILD